MITDVEQAPSNLVWSWDGKSIAYTARVPGKPDWSVHMPEKPAGAKWADPPIYITRLRWSADGAGLIQPGYTQIFVVPSIGGAPRQITSDDVNHAGEVAWTRDNQELLYSATAGPEAEYSLEGGDIYSVPVAGGSAKQLTTRKGPDQSPTVSPDGKHIAYLGFDFHLQSYNVTHLYVMDASGSNPKRLAPDLDRDVRAPRWSNDGKGLYVVVEDRGAAHLYYIGLDGSRRQITTGSVRYATSYAGSDSFTVSENGRVAVVRSSPAEPPDVVTFALSKPANVTRLSQANDSLLASHELAGVEEISYDSFDGRPIQGWIVKPPHFDPSKKYPLLLDIHGGPHAMYGVEFQEEFQIYAGHGFVVLYVNPRGSTGYGEEFGDIIHTKYPGDDFKDLMAGVDAVIAKGYIDPKRLAVTGGSGGGLLTAWIIGHTDRFAAAVSQYPVTNWFTQVGTADGGYFHAANWMKSMPWDNPQQYIQHSPVFFAQNFVTPTMIITGQADHRTPIAQSEELYFALKARKVPAVLVEIPDEPHGIRGAHPSHRIAKNENILGWIEKYTKASPNAPNATSN
jgi:dipeptidyl aminopeptidase/acylaminoacyl peptidase